MPVIYNSLERTLGEECFDRLRGVRFKDCLNYLRGGREVGEWDLKVHSRFIDRGDSRSLLGKIKKGLYGVYREFEEGKVYDSAVDGAALNLSSLFIAFIHEKGIAGMPLEQHAYIRAVGLVSNTVTARIYEKIRNKVFDALAVTDETCVKKYFVDTGLFLTLQMPLHWFNMITGTLLYKGTIEKEDWVRMAVASLSLVPVAALWGGPYGLFRDGLRKSAGLPTEHEES